MICVFRLFSFDLYFCYFIIFILNHTPLHLCFPVRSYVQNM